MNNQRTTPHSAASAQRRAAVDQIIAGFRDAMKDIRCLGSERLLRAGVSMSHLHAMSLLEAHGPISMTRLADHVGVSMSNLTGLVDRMEERSLVERFRMPGDRRVVHVRISDHGRRTLGELEMLKQDAFVDILATLDDEALARLAASATDFRTAVAGWFAAHPEAAVHGHTPASRSTSDQAAGTAAPQATVPVA